MLDPASQQISGDAERPFTPVPHAALTREQNEFADWLKRCLGQFEKPTQHRLTNGKSGGAISGEHAPLTDEDTGCKHAHATPCAHTLAPLALSPMFHCYSIRGPLRRISRQDWASWGMRQPAAFSLGIWYCATLAQAAQRYSWRSFNLAGVLTPFSTLAHRLQTAMAAGNVVDTRTACWDIIRWGGLTHYRGARAALAWITASGGNLIHHIDDATSLLRPSASGPLTRFDGTDLLMDSATTKIYAAAALDCTAGAQDVLMYDARVGAALCLLVRHFIEARHSKHTPASLKLEFLCGREARRNPSKPGIYFPTLSNDAAGHQARADAARLGARILQRALGTPTTCWQFAEFEKALFMIGYDVKNLCCGCPRP